MGRVFSIIYFCRNKHPTWLLHAFVSRVICAAKFSKTCPGGDTSALFNAFIAANSLSLNDFNIVGWFFWSFLFCGPASHANCETKRRNTLHRPEKNQSSVMFVDSRSSIIASVLWEAISRHLGRMNCLRSLSVSVKKWNFWSLRVTPALFNIARTFRRWRICYFGVLQNISISSKYTSANCHFTFAKKTFMGSSKTFRSFQGFEWDANESVQSVMRRDYRIVLARLLDFKSLGSATPVKYRKECVFLERVSALIYL